MGKNQDPGSGINIPDPQHGNAQCFVSALVSVRFRIQHFNPDADLDPDTDSALDPDFRLYFHKESKRFLSLFSTCCLFCSFMASCFSSRGANSMLSTQIRIRNTAVAGSIEIYVMDFLLLQEVCNKDTLLPLPDMKQDSTAEVIR
jgi:hypothetical protein